jgi:Fic family protein
MSRFLEWFDAWKGGWDGLIRAGIAHLWFVTIHPFDDGNGRIGRAIADMAIAKAEATARIDGGGHRYYSLSSAILQQRHGYYRSLEDAAEG